MRRRSCRRGRERGGEKKKEAEEEEGRRWRKRRSRRMTTTMTRRRKRRIAYTHLCLSLCTCHADHINIVLTAAKSFLPIFILSRYGKPNINKEFLCQFLSLNNYSPLGPGLRALPAFC